MEPKFPRVYVVVTKRLLFGDHSFETFPTMKTSAHTVLKIAGFCVGSNHQQSVDAELSNPLNKRKQLKLIRVGTDFDYLYVFLLCS